ncbi:helix-turn-helix domain-containing protein [Streptomyces sp. Inha503]|uniref:helix-turn-helix domain-containing protein n=1 Tax=Streptomyces sp. Inha503 TaxID=3383314 RepID=UPI0039A30A1B
MDKEEVNKLVAEATSDDTLKGLAAVRALRRLVEDIETLQVRRARDLGWAWGDIAEPLGISRQSAHKKHARRRAK